jgi:heptosyltransferase-2
MLTLSDYIEETDYRFTSTELEFDRRRLIKPDYIVIAPSSKHFTKTYPKEKFAELIRKIKHHKIVLVGERTKRDMSICRYLSKASSKASSNIINYCGKINYRALANVLNFSELVICNDSGILHLSEALRKKVVAIFGCTVKEFGFYPQLDNSIVLEVNNLQCRPCTHIGKDKCPKKHFNCMNEINVSDFPNL